MSDFAYVAQHLKGVRIGLIVNRTSSNIVPRRKTTKVRVEVPIAYKIRSTAFKTKVRRRHVQLNAS